MRLTNGPHHEPSSALSLLQNLGPIPDMVAVLYHSLTSFVSSSWAQSVEWLFGNDGCGLCDLICWIAAKLASCQARVEA
eukprot:2301608-Amphidinium_carterae.1